MAKVGGMHSQTNMVLYVIAGIILVGMIFFGVGFKVGNSSVEGFYAKGKGKGKQGLGALIKEASELVAKSPKQMPKQTCDKYKKTMKEALGLLSERGKDLQKISAQAKQKKCM